MGLLLRLVVALALLAPGVTVADAAPLAAAGVGPAPPPGVTVVQYRGGRGGGQYRRMPAYRGPAMRGGPGYRGPRGGVPGYRGPSGMRRGPGMPRYAARGPGYRAPGYRAPGYRGPRPGYRGPAYAGRPGYRGPGYRAPGYRGPGYRGPRYGPRPVGRYYRGGRWYPGAPRWRGARRWHGGYYWRPAYDGWYYWNNGAWLWAPVFGVLAGAALAAPYGGYYGNDVTVVVTYEPWSDAWYQWCSARYRSFNPSTGYFLGYDGRRHFCVYRP